MSTTTYTIGNKAKAIARINWQNLLLLFSATAIVGMFYLSSNGSDISGVNPDPTPPTIAATPSKSGDDNEKSVDDIVNDALIFYNMLNSTQQASLQLTYSTSLARKWSNLPCGSSCRNGLQMGTDLTSAQYQAAMKVIEDALSTEGYTEFHDMNMAEAYLHANGGGSGYDSTLRWIAFLNVPTATGPWMLQFGGHHYAANIAFNNGHVIGATPFFMGLEPKTFTYASVAYDPLGDEKTAFATTLASLSSTELSTAYLSSSFSDIVMSPGETNGGTATFPAVALGQAISSLSTTQKANILTVIDKYTGDMDDATHAYMYALYESELDQSYISYHGSGTSGSASSFLVASGDYVRISGPHCWIEFSCQSGIVIQNQIHYHTIWRDRVHDYGVDLSGDAVDGDGTSGLSENSVNTKITVYPNPTTDKITAKLPESVSNATVVVIDQQGRTVQTIHNVSGNKLQVDADNLANGNYVLKIVDKSHNYTSKFNKR
jgi:hypothetical protein